MTERLYTKYDTVRNFVNRGRLPKTREETLAIADIFHNHTSSKLTTQAAEYASEINHHGRGIQLERTPRSPSCSERPLLRSVETVDRTNLTKIDRKQLKRLKNKSDPEEVEVAPTKTKSKKRRR